MQSKQKISIYTKIKSTRFTTCGLLVRKLKTQLYFYAYENCCKIDKKILKKQINLDKKFIFSLILLKFALEIQNIYG